MIIGILFLVLLGLIFARIVTIGRRNATVNRYYPPKKLEIIYRKKLVEVLGRKS